MLILLRKNRGGQASLEYAILVTILIGAFIGAGVYFKRGVQGKWKEVSDGMADQYDPRYMNTDLTYKLNAEAVISIQTIPGGGGIWTMREDRMKSTETKTGNSRVGATDSLF